MHQAIGAALKVFERQIKPHILDPSRLSDLRQLELV